MKLGWGPKRHKRPGGGFSVVEAVIGMLLFGMTAVALYSGIMSGYQTMRMARENQKATQILTEVMELIRLYSFEQVNTVDFIPTTFTVVDTASNSSTTSSKDKSTTPTGITYTGKITIADPGITTNYGSQLRQVTVELTWMTGGIQRVRNLSTLVAFDGLYSYVY